METPPEDPKLDATRRNLLGTATLGAVMMAAFSGKAQAQGAGWSAAEQANVKVVNDFLEAIKPKDMSGQLAYLAPDCVYRMTETSPPDKGFEAITNRLKGYVDNASAIELKVLSTFCSGPIVINHRIDKFTSTTQPLLFEGGGVFFVKNGKIKEWTDYTIKVG